MSKLPYEEAIAIIEDGEDVVLCSNDNAFFDPWGNVGKLDIS